MANWFRLGRTANRVRIRTWRMQMQVRWPKGRDKVSNEDVLIEMGEGSEAVWGRRCTCHRRPKAVENPD